jgi:hypothetical protein
MAAFPDGFEAKIEEIQRLLDEAYAHYFEFSDGHCKSSEGWIQIDLPTYFMRRDGDEQVAVSVYSYALGPSRLHRFESVDEALENVKQWHADEMTRDHTDPVWSDS